MKRWLGVIVVIVALGGLIGWRLQQKNAEAAAQNAQREARKKAPPVVSVATAETRDVTHIYQAVGSVQSQLNVNVSPKVAGIIEYLPYQPGDRVTAGEVLARIDQSQYVAQLQQARAALAEAKQRLAQAEITQNPTNVQVTTAIRQQEAALASTRADYNQVRQNYNQQVAAAQAAVTDAQGRVNVAEAGIANAQASITSAQANQVDAEAKYNRESALYKQGFVAAQDVDDAKAAYNVQNANVLVAQGQLRSAQAQRDSALAQLNSAKNQLAIAKTSGHAAIEDARTKVVAAQAALDYARANTAQQPAYVANLAALRSQVEAQEANVRNAEAQLSYTVLRSSINGYVTSRLMDPGATANVGQTILQILTVRDVWITVPVPEEVSRHVAYGQGATVVLDALPGQTFHGRVVQVNPSADPESRLFQVRVLVENPRDQIKPGMFATVTFMTERVRGATVVPLEAVQTSKAGPFAVVVNEDLVAHHVPISTGAQDDRGIAVLTGLKPGDRVVTLSLGPVRDGQKVKIAGAGREGAQRGGAAATPTGGG